MKALLLPFGYSAYPKDLVLERLEESKKHLERLNVDFIATDLILDVSDAIKVRKEVKNCDFDCIIVLLSTWIEATNVIEVVDEYKHLPMMLWTHENIDKGDELVSLGSIAAAGVMRETFEEFEYKFTFVVGNPQESKIDDDILSFHRAVSAVRSMKSARAGLVGYVSLGMYTGLADHIKVKKVFGTEVFHIDQYSWIKDEEMKDITFEEKEKVIKDILENWTLTNCVSKEHLEKCAYLYCKLKKLIEEHKLNGATIKCQYEMSLEYGFSPCMPLSLMGMEMPICCEGDLNQLLSQMILHGISGKKPTTYGDMLHFYDDENSVICAACGFAPKAFLAPKKPVIDAHTAIVSGMMSTSTFKPADVTVIRLANDKQGYKMHLIKGEISELKGFHEVDCPAYSGSVIHLENKNIQDFKKEIMSQHYAIVEGNYIKELELFCQWMGIRIV